jgi:hypothetical protein
MRSFGRQPLRGARIETVQHALKTVGSVSRLAKLLEVKPERLRRWAMGEEPVPLEAFLEALDVLARGPYEPQRKAPTRRPVVALIPGKEI